MNSTLTTALTTIPANAEPRFLDTPAGICDDALIHAPEQWAWVPTFVRAADPDRYEDCSNDDDGGIIVEVEVPKAPLAGCRLYIVHLTGVPRDADDHLLGVVAEARQIEFEVLGSVTTSEFADHSVCRIDCVALAPGVAVEMSHAFGEYCDDASDAQMTLHLCVGPDDGCRTWAESRVDGLSATVADEVRALLASTLPSQLPSIAAAIDAVLASQRTSSTALAPTD